jgi:hypothetical protein
MHDVAETMCSTALGKKELVCDDYLGSASMRAGGRWKEAAGLKKAT